MNIYVELTQHFNAGRLRAIISSGQAVVLHRLAFVSKDGDWIVREDEEALGHILRVLAGHGARYRFGAPLDIRWLAGGWSSHFEFRQDKLRVRTDFVARPPRIAAGRLAEIWQEQEGRDLPYCDAPDLAQIKKTNREIDYAIIGDLARLMAGPRDQLLHCRSARDLIRLAERHGELAERLAADRPALGHISEGRDALEAALDAERRALIRANEARLQAYFDAARRWRQLWPEVQRQTAALPLPEAHDVVAEAAEGVLPFRVGGAGDG